ncbi:MAG TPA: hypothetical protein VER39_02385 [Nocardioidaceae bacterium]|nr:hypothetical protein [Nocardioidaceae bacterium]
MDDEVEEQQDIFDVEAQMSAIDFDNPTRWRVKTLDGARGRRRRSGVSWRVSPQVWRSARASAERA